MRIFTSWSYGKHIDLLNIFFLNPLYVRLCAKTETSAPTLSPTYVKGAPTPVPTPSPTLAPVASPTCFPMQSPTSIPTLIPTTSPTQVPTPNPSGVPSSSPSVTPSSYPTGPTYSPTRQPTAPTAAPTPKPSAPTACPSTKPTTTPTTPRVFTMPCYFSTGRIAANCSVTGASAPRLIVNSAFGVAGVTSAYGMLALQVAIKPTTPSNADNNYSGCRSWGSWFCQFWFTNARTGQRLFVSGGVLHWALSGNTLFFIPGLQSQGVAGPPGGQAANFTSIFAVNDEIIPR